MDHIRQRVAGVGLLCLSLVLVGAGCSAPAAEAPTSQATTPAPAAAPAAETMLSLDKSEYAAGESIIVAFDVVASDAASFSDTAWLGVIPSNVAHGSEAEADRHDVSYQYLNNATEGSKTFNSPGPGSWDIRLLSSDSNGTEVASVSFTVAQPESAAAPPAEDSPYPVGTTVYAQWTTNSWYRGTIDRTCSGGLHVQYDDGDQKCATLAELTADTVPAASQLAVGTNVLAQWVGAPFYTATITAVEGNDQYKVRYYDNVESTVSRSQIRLP